MNTTSDHTRESNGTTFKIDSGEDWTRFCADINLLLQRINEQITIAVANIDFDAIGREVKTAMQEAGEEIRRAMKDVSDETRKDRPTHVHMDFRTSQPTQESPPAAEPATDERMTVLDLVAQGKITADEGARLLEALGA